MSFTLTTDDDLAHARRVLGVVHTTHLDVEERPVFAPAAGLLSYRVHVEYTDADNWDWTSLDLLEEARERDGTLVNRVVPLDGYRPDQPQVATGLRALIRADLMAAGLWGEMQDAVLADIRRRRDDAADLHFRRAA